MKNPEIEGENGFHYMYHQPLGLPHKKKLILYWSYNLKKHEKEGEWSLV